MNLSFIEKILIKGALKGNNPFIRISSLFLEIIFIVFAVVFLIMYIVKKQNILFADALLFAFGALLIFIIRRYQNIIRKIRQNQEQNSNKD